MFCCSKKKWIFPRFSLEIGGFFHVFLYLWGMNKVVNRKISYKVDSSKYADIETGELPGDGIRITEVKKTGQFIINSDEFVIFDAASVRYISGIIRKVDLARVIIMANMVRGDCCVICQDEKTPHTPVTLSDGLQITLHEWNAYVRKLVKKGILAYCVCAPSGFIQKVYMLNPFIARKRKAINESMGYFFNDIAETHRKSLPEGE